MASHHSALPRGLDATRSALFQGRFGRMFRNLPPAQFGATDAANRDHLSKLATTMTAGLDKPKDGPDAEESGIPALYTYFGQFIDHDLTFDPVSVLTKAQDPDGLIDFRTPALDLDNIYGRGPGDQPYLYDKLKFQLGDPLKGPGLPDAFDLPRFKGRALIGDPRNDENSIVSQLQGLFLRFHNRMVEDNPHLSFEEIQQLVRFHYQYVILHDFLPRIVSAPVLEDLKSGQDYDRSKIKFFHWKNYPFIPVEFSVACYRLGHSMIRPGYRLNDSKAMLLPIFPVKGKGLPVGLTGFQTMAEGRAIDWGRFIDIDLRAYGEEDKTTKDNRRRLQLAYRIDASLVNPLQGLPTIVASDPPPSLALRNLERGWLLGLPSGQSVANAMNIIPLKDPEILIGKAVDKPGKGETPVPIHKIAGGAFRENCPLWAYILAEAAHHQIALTVPAIDSPPINTPQLGPVGGRIVAEVLLGLMFGDNFSMLSLQPKWTPVTGPDFKLKHFVSFALGHGPKLH